MHVCDALDAAPKGKPFLKQMIMTRLKSAVA